MKRDSSPPLAIRVSGANGAPGLVETTNSTRSRPRAPHCPSASGLDQGAEPGGVELERRQLARDRGVEPARGGGARRAQPARPLPHRRRGARGTARSQLGEAALRRPRAPRAARPSSAASAGSASASTRCLRASARISNSRASASSSRAGSKVSASAARGERVLGLGRLDQRPVERRQRLGQQRMLAADPLEPAQRLAQLRQRRLRSPSSKAGRPAARSSASRAPFCMLARSSASSASSPCSRRQPAELGDRMFEPFAVARRERQSSRAPRRAPLRPRPRPRQARSAAPASIRPKESSRARWPRGLSRPRSSCWPWISTSSAPSSRSRATEAGLVVDEGAAAAVGLDDPADDQRLAGFAFEAVFGEQGAGGMVRRELEGDR